MRAFLRSSAPAVLDERIDGWTARWVKKTSASGAKFEWPRLDKRSLNHWLLPALNAQTQGHCSYCDGFPLDSIAGEQIDHFRPKARDLFPELAFTWSNLYLSCPHCNKVKRERFDERLLAADEPEFAFERYFDFDGTSGHLQPNPAATIDDRIRAATSIKIFGLNDDGMPQARMRALDQLQGWLSEDNDLDLVPFRFLFELYGDAL